MYSGLTRYITGRFRVLLVEHIKCIPCVLKTVCGHYKYTGLYRSSLKPLIKMDHKDLITMPWLYKVKDHYVYTELT